MGISHKYQVQVIQIVSKKKKPGHATIQRHPKASIVNIGCGLDTTFNHVDNDTIMFYELDLPEVIALRKNSFKRASDIKALPLHSWIPNALIK